jgi:two-component system chemotaxis response regulator CheY
MPLKVLIVDDDRASLELMSDVLSAADINVRPVSDSRQAATLVESEKFDGIFLDLQMPGLHGLELTRQIRTSSWNKSTPVVIVTGWDERTAMQQVFDRGATFFLQKPLDRQRLLRLFRTASGSMMDNRRRFMRIPLRTLVVCQGRDATARVMSCNISQGGILLEPVHFRLGDQMRLSFSLPDSEVTVNAGGVVVRIDERLYVGVQFTNMNDAGRESIRQVVERMITV